MGEEPPSLTYASGAAAIVTDRVRHLRLHARALIGGGLLITIAFAALAFLRHDACEPRRYNPRR